MAAHGLKARVRNLNPGCFAAVMATGIVSIDVMEHGMARLAVALLVLNVILWLWLLVLSVWRLAAWPHSVIEDFSTPSRGASFLTMSAGTLVLANQFIEVVHWPRTALALTIVGTIFWAALIYLFLAGVITARVKPHFSRSINGGWLIAVVATQAVSVVVTQQATDPAWLFVSLSLYMLGAALYLMIITLVVYRMVFLRLRARDFTPPYWINMGALAITTLAGSELVLHAPDTGPVARLVPFVEGFTVFFWATATWWIPLLIILGIWRHLWQHVRWHYDTDDWDIVFPLGMYTVGTLSLSQAIGADFLRPIANVGVWINIAVWIIVAAAALRALMPSRRPLA